MNISNIMLELFLCVVIAFLSCFSSSSLFVTVVIVCCNYKCACVFYYEVMNLMHSQLIPRPVIPR